MKKNINTGRQETSTAQSASCPAGSPAQPSVPLYRPSIGATPQLGFTLIEVMTVLAVAIVLVGVAVPAIGDFIRNSRMVAQTNEFVADLAYARSEAIKRSTRVAICKSSDPIAASPTCTTAGDDWSTGWLVFVDNGTATPNNSSLDSGEELLRIHPRLDGANVLKAGANLASNVTFTRLGLSTLAASDSFALCDARGTSRGRGITIELAGRATISRNPTTCDPP